MKKRLLALIMALVMILSLSSVNVFARYSVEDGSYNYRKTETLEASVEGEKIVITWPAVDKSGNLINANPLESNSIYGDPKGGWTYPTQGMIIEYPNWNVDGTHTANPTQLNTGECKILYGMTDRVTDYPVVCVDPKTNEKIKDAYIDATPVADNFATAYKIEYSEDGTTWKLDHMETTVNHGKKLYRAKEDGSFAPDPRNTFFLEDQYCVELIGNFKDDTEYNIRVTATNAAKTSESYKVFETKITTPKAAVKYPAFPTVEGSGVYSQGGRGTVSKPADVYVVTNLTDSVTNPQPGSLRYGLLREDRADKDRTYPRIITFAVGGVIKVDETADKNARRFNIGSNTTILGQTAPGEGITVYGASTKFDGKDIIARYIRFRLGEGYDLDAATATGENIVIDHCTFTWGVDECFTAKEIINSSIQYNIIANSLGFPNKTGIHSSDAEIMSGESEAKHGMGSILNGSDVTYTHNLWANHGTRNPRFEGGFNYSGVYYDNKLEFSNNVVYNWGHNSGYGGERGSGNTNMVGNYYKPGSNTLEKVNTRIFQTDGGKSKYYFRDNVMTSSKEVTNDNFLGYAGFTKNLQLTEPVALQYPYTATSADEAYNAVLDGVGASYVRDAQDARLINEVKSGTGTIVNNEFEAGGIGTAQTEIASTNVDTDMDGIPDEWETAHGLNPNDKSDATAIVTDETKSYLGYTNVEVYACDILGEWAESTSKPEKTNNAIVAINSIDGALIGGNANDVNTVISKGKSYTINKTVTGVANSYSILLNDRVIAENTDTFTIPTDVETGVYNIAINAKSDNGNGISTPLPVIVIDETHNSNIEGFTSVEVGDTRATGGDFYDANKNELISTGNGHLGILNTSSDRAPDYFHFNYKEVTGDFTFTAQVDNLAKIDYRQQSGIMVRASLDTESEFYMPALTYIKGEDYGNVKDVTGSPVKAKNIYPILRAGAGANITYGTKFLGIPAVRVDQAPNHGWSRIERRGQEIILSASLDGTNWYEVGTYTSTLPETVLVGFATDSAQDKMELARYNATKFSNISLNVDTTPRPVLGDSNSDREVTILDAARVLNYVLAPAESDMTDTEIANCMVADGTKITSTDVAEILQKVLDSTYKFTVER